MNAIDSHAQNEVRTHKPSLFAVNEHAHARQVDAVLLDLLQHLVDLAAEGRQLLCWDTRCAQM